MIDVKKLDKKSLAAMIDFSILPKETTKEEIIEGCHQTCEYGFAAFYSSSSFWSPLIAEQLADRPEIEVGAGLAFPFGTQTPYLKAIEVEEAVKRGCTAVDIVMNVGALRSGDLETIREELKNFVSAAGDAVTKYILETCFLNPEEIKIASELAIEAGVAYIKTSSGQFQGPSLEEVLIMREAAEGTDVKLKVAGVKFPRAQNALVFIKAGAERIGTRAGIEIVNSLDALRQGGVI